MDDTSPKIAAMVRKMLLERSGAERLAMGSQMFKWHARLFWPLCLPASPTWRSSAASANGCMGIKRIRPHFAGNCKNDSIGEYEPRLFLVSMISYCVCPVNGLEEVFSILKKRWSPGEGRWDSSATSARLGFIQLSGAHDRRPSRDEASVAGRLDAAGLEQ